MERKTFCKEWVLARQTIQEITMRTVGNSSLRLGAAIILTTCLLFQPLVHLTAQSGAESALLQQLKAAIPDASGTYWQSINDRY